MSTPITEYRNAKIISEDGSRIDVEINHPDHGWIPYTLDTSDTDMTIDNSALLTLIGSNKEAYVAPTAEEILAEKERDVREERYGLLVEMDEILANPLRWAAMSTEQQNSWASYRQALLDISEQSGFPDNVTWPTKPDV
tara:strand:- start:3725 stop:4141 length:417 start_codon:yes stop_codon:yes gene_type:complete